jgi:Domain of unknown function (DUF1992)
MTERKPSGISFESWVDKQVREAEERGDFDDLPGTGKPLPCSSGPHDENRWIKQKLASEGLSTDALLPTPIQLRKEIDRLPDTVRGLKSERAVREVVTNLNHEIVDWLRAPSGPRIPMHPVDADDVVEQWRSDRAQREEKTPASPVTDEPSRTAWWHRFTRRQRVTLSGVAEQTRSPSGTDLRMDAPGRRAP